jgi:uncharacterized protein (TIGR04255 family)
MAFAFEFSTPLQAEVLTSLRQGEVHAKLLEQLPRHTEQRGVVINFGMPQLQIPTPQPPLNGLLYDSLKPNGEPSWAVNILSNMLVVVCGEYSRWARVWERAQEFFMIVLPHILSATAIGTVGLQYTDEFGALGNKAQFTLNGVFNPESRFIPRNIIGAHGPCHSHHGFFEHIDTPSPSRVLTNVNVDVGEDSGKMKINITTAHRCIFASPIPGTSDQLLAANGVIGKTFAALHVLNKSVVGDILTTDVKAAINFDRPPQA